ncbi:MAG: HAD-IA family hydrolase [Actinomycetota bacterium]|nr:HAD-IA family hydrolase [Actinomycetota bacterium]
MGEGRVSQLPHVVWDMGGILYRYFTELMLDVGEERGWPLERIPLGPTGRLADADYQSMLDGGLDEPDYVTVVRARLEAEGIDFDPPRELDWLGETRTETWLAIEEIDRRRHRQALLTNDASRWLGENWWETWERGEVFDSIIDSVTVGARKPAPEPYLATAAALGVSPTECLFVDDLPVNCRGAEAVGMQSHPFVIADSQGSLDALLTRLALGTSGS